MSISANYPTPVTVNGYSCRNCTEVEEAQKFIDPAHPKSGPFGVDAKSDPTVSASAAFQLGGVLAQGAQSSVSAQAPTGTSPLVTSGARVDVSA